MLPLFITVFYHSYIAQQESLSKRNMGNLTKKNKQVAFHTTFVQAFGFSQLHSIMTAHNRLPYKVFPSAYNTVYTSSICSRLHFLKCSYVETKLPHYPLLFGNGGLCRKTERTFNITQPSLQSLTYLLYYNAFLCVSTKAGEISPIAI